MANFYGRGHFLLVLCLAHIEGCHGYCGVYCGYNWWSMWYIWFVVVGVLLLCCGAGGALFRRRYRANQLRATVVTAGQQYPQQQLHGQQYPQQPYPGQQYPVGQQYPQQQQYPGQSMHGMQYPPACSPQILTPPAYSTVVGEPGVTNMAYQHGGPGSDTKKDPPPPAYTEAVSLDRPYVLPASAQSGLPQPQRGAQSPHTAPQPAAGSNNAEL